MVQLSKVGYTFPRLMLITLLVVIHKDKLLSNISVSFFFTFYDKDMFWSIPLVIDSPTPFTIYVNFYTRTTRTFNWTTSQSVKNDNNGGVTLNTVSRPLAAQIIAVSNVEARLFQYCDKNGVFFNL